MRGRVLTGFTSVLVVACSNSADSPPPAISLTSEAETTASAPETTASGAQPTSGAPTATQGTGTTPTSTSPVTTPSGSGGAGEQGPGPALPVTGTGTGTATPPALPTTTSTTTTTTTASGTNTSVPSPSGESTCVSGIQTGSACNPSADTESCVRFDRTCECGADSKWACSMGVDPAPTASNTTPGTGGAGGGGTGGPVATGGAGGGGTGTVELDCDATMPTAGSEQHSNTWAQGGMGNTAWQIWTNGGPGNITTFGDVPAFIASWNNSGDYLGRMGFEWGNSGKAYSEYGTITADYVWNKTGTAGQYSYIGVYGWSNNPCVEWYIVEDSFHQMPFNTGDQPIGTAEVDGGTYNLVYRRTSGTGGDRCGGAGSWDQFYSIRLEGKRCGTITVSDHFDVWAEKGWALGNLLEVKIVVEAAAGQGSVEFPVANVKTSQ